MESPMLMVLSGIIALWIFIAGLLCGIYNRLHELQKLLSFKDNNKSNNSSNTKKNITP
jgi:hypothetical protein